MHIELVNKDGKIKKCKMGISWTFLFFGPFVMLFRLDIASLLTVTTINFLATTFIHPVASWIVTIIGVFMYNKYHIKKLIKMGYTPRSEDDRRIIEQNKLMAF